MSKRQSQVAELLRRHISLVLQESGIYIFGAQPLVTVTHVIVTADMALAKIYLSIYNAEQPQIIMDAIQHALPEIKQNFYKRIKSHMRRMPEIQFYLDDTLEAAMQEASLFQKLYEADQMGNEEE
ncbi:MAG TPA: 30S ribosome-binding factor RbfA [Saprospiraceae bacterium]|nr:30S ribosome-binding factor RbfA [Saprospiraceae bacterium]HQW55820.1 30S ribosome-binding factor RbfA [Saprospiraceae bacterium]